LLPVRPLRIDHVVATFPPYLAGTGLVAFHNALQLGRLGHRVRVLTADYPVPTGWRDPIDFAVERLPRALALGNAPFTPGLLARLAGADVVHLHWPYIFGSELTWFACRALRKPYVVTYHIDLVGAGLRAPLFAAYQRIWGPRVVGDAAEVFAVSLDHFRSTAGARWAASRRTPVREVSNGVDLSRFSPGPRDAARGRLGIDRDASVALFVAALDRAHHYKGLGFVLEAMGDLPGAQLVVVGDGDLRAEYEAKAQSRRLDGRVRFVGAVSHDVLPDYYRAADLTVLPSTQTESFGLVLAESLACGTPAVATNLPGVRSVVEDGVTGRLVPIGSSVAISRAVAELLADADARRAMGEAGRRKAVERYDWRRIGRQLDNAYAEVLARAA
jgi:glycosyltransferase involved in cell wall biosynthesis